MRKNIRCKSAKIQVSKRPNHRNTFCQGANIENTIVDFKKKQNIYSSETQNKTKEHVKRRSQNKYQFLKTPPTNRVKSRETRRNMMRKKFRTYLNSYLEDQPKQEHLSIKNRWRYLQKYGIEFQLQCLDMLRYIEDQSDSKRYRVKAPPRKA